MDEKELAVRLLAALEGTTPEHISVSPKSYATADEWGRFAAEAARVVKEARVSALEEVAVIVKYNDAHVLFAAVEMTSGELSAVRAILKIKHSMIQRLIDAETEPKGE